MKYHLFSLGYRCSSAGILKQLQLKKESYPFDWIVSRLPIIRHCLETNFRHFIEDISTNYSPTQTSTIHYDLDPTNNMFVCDEKVVYNTFYAKFPLAPFHTSIPLCIPTDTYSYPLLMNHHNIFNEKDREYFGRCIERLNHLLNSPHPSENVGKMYLYIHPALRAGEFTTHRTQLIQEILDFQRFLQTKYPHTYPKGLCFIPVKTVHPYPITEHYPDVIEEIHNTLDANTEPQCIICLVYMNKDFVDAGEIFMRNAYIETDKMIHYIKQYAAPCV